MISDEDSGKRRRGRPAKRHSASHISVSDTGSHLPVKEKVTHTVQEVTASEDEQQHVNVTHDDQLSLFSSLLRHILRKDRTEIARVAQALEVTETTIYRWMNGNVDPRAAHLKNILEVLPEHRNNLIYAINKSFPGVLDTFSHTIREIQKDIYRRVMELVATTVEDDARQWQIIQTVFEYALLHLDAERKGLAISYAKLMPAHDDGIHSLYETTMRGNYPWPFSLESQAYLGSTTLAGTAAMLQRLQTWDDLSESERLQVEIDDFEKSACAYPVKRGGRLSGVLIVSSTQPDFFTDPVARQSVIEYAQLLALAFPEQDFKPFSDLSLRPMPSLKWQREEITRTYINRIITCARKLRLSRQEAEVVVRREMELEFEERARSQHLQRHSEQEQSYHS